MGKLYVRGIVTWCMDGAISGLGDGEGLGLGEVDPAESVLLVSVI